MRYLRSIKKTNFENLLYEGIRVEVVDNFQSFGGCSSDVSVGLPGIVSSLNTTLFISDSAQ